MPATAAQLVLLEAALFSGELTVKHGDKTITYRSVAELREAVEMARREVASPKRRVASVAGYKRFG